MSADSPANSSAPTEPSSSDSTDSATLPTASEETEPAAETKPTVEAKPIFEPNPIYGGMADKLRTIQNLEALQSRYVGTGHADTTKHEWANNIIRDSYASYIGHPPMLSYMAAGMGIPREKLRVMMLEKMVRGAGNPPETKE